VTFNVEVLQACSL